MRGDSPFRQVHVLEGLLGLLCLLWVSPTLGQAPGDPREAHGTFTGEIKPVLYVSDVEEAAPFYRDVLGFGFEGFATVDSGPYYAEMTAAGVKFGLHEPMSDRQRETVGRQRLYVRVEDLPAHRSRVLARGAEAGEIKTRDWMDMLLVRDADGNEIVFAVTDPERHSSNPWNTEEPVAREPARIP